MEEAVMEVVIFLTNPDRLHQMGIHSLDWHVSKRTIIRKSVTKKMRLWVCFDGLTFGQLQDFLKSPFIKRVYLVYHTRPEEAIIQGIASYLKGRRVAFQCKKSFQTPGNQSLYLSLRGFPNKVKEQDFIRIRESIYSMSDWKNQMLMLFEDKGAYLSHQPDIYEFPPQMQQLYKQHIEGICEINYERCVAVLTSALDKYVEEFTAKFNH